MAITSFDRANCKMLADLVQKTLKDLGEQHGVKFQLAGGRFSEGDFTFKISTKLTDPKASQEAAFKNFAARCIWYGLQVTDFGKTFKDIVTNKTYTVVGINTRRSRYGVQMKGMDGKTYCFCAESFKTHLRRV